MIGSVRLVFVGFLFQSACLKASPQSVETATETRTSPKAYSMPRRAEFERENAHCLGHSLLNTCFFRFTNNTFTKTTPPEYPRWPSTTGVKPLSCMRNSDAGFPCAEGSTGEWIQFSASRSIRVSIQTVFWEPLKPESGSHTRMVTEFSGIPLVPAFEEENGFADGVKLWALDDGPSGILFERAIFIGE
jgi:hypothetical protein